MGQGYFSFLAPFSIFEAAKVSKISLIMGVIIHLSLLTSKYSAAKEE